MTVRHRTRQLATAALLLGLLLAAWAAFAPAATTIKVVQPDGDVERVDLADVRPRDRDVGPNQEYVVGGQSVPVTGISLDKLLQDYAGVGAWKRVTIRGESLTHAQYLAYGDETPPAFFEQDGDARFVVPDRGNSTGRIVSVARVATSGWTVEITPDGEEIDAGDSVTFTARVGGGSAGGLRFSWGGDGLNDRSGQSVTYRFSKKGTYQVTVTARKDGEFAAQDGTTVFVDRKPSDRSDGGDGDDGGGSTGGIGPPGSDTPSYTPPTYTDPYTDPYSDPYTDPSTDPTTPPSEQAPDETEPSPPPDTTVAVAGDLLADTGALPPGSSSSDDGLDLPDLPEVTPEDDAASSVSEGVVAAAVLALLLGLGAGREFERLDPRRWRRRPNLGRLRSLLPRRWK